MTSITDIRGAVDWMASGVYDVIDTSSSPADDPRCATQHAARIPQGGVLGSDTAGSPPRPSRLRLTSEEQ